MRKEQHQRRDQDIDSAVEEQEPRRPVIQRQRGVDLIEPALQPVEFRYGFLNFLDDGKDHPQVAAAMLADGGLVLDRLGAKRTFHCDYAGRERDRRPRLVASRACARSSSARSLSRFCRSSVRSASSAGGIAVSRLQLAQTGACSSFSEWQNGHCIRAQS
jgi:hypothetical protein